MKIDINHAEHFVKRHNSPSASSTETNDMLAFIGAKSLDELVAQTVPAHIRLKKPLALPPAQTEFQFLNNLKKKAAKNKVFRSFMGMGYHENITPNVILRNILENPGWYTAYTPYQAEIAQGRLEALLNYQTMVIDLTGMEMANASLLDEGTAAAEAMRMLHVTPLKEKKEANTFFVSELCHPQTIAVLKNRAEPVGIKLIIGSHKSIDLTNPDLFGALLQYPGTDGSVENYSHFVSAAKEQHVRCAFATDLLALTMLTPPGEMGAEVVFGSSHRFGVPMGFGGPHAAFFATKESYKRFMPGRIIGVTKDSAGKNALRMALQTREQHIKREKATSNICTAQVLLAVMAGMYAVYHGPDALRKMAGRVHGLAKLTAISLEKIGFGIAAEHFFDCITVNAHDKKMQFAIREIAERRGYNFRYFNDQHIGISFAETSSLDDVRIITYIFAEATAKFKSVTPGVQSSVLPSLSDSPLGVEHGTLLAQSVQNELNTLINEASKGLELNWPNDLCRSSDFLTHPVFNKHQSEHEMLRYMKHLENKDLSLAHSMIALGSCTMKLNATAEMIPITWPEFCNMHPFAPQNQTEGYREVLDELSAWLCEVTGFDAVSLQPNSGAQGEYAGLMVIRAYHLSRGDAHRNIALIPSSAHGTNPASAVMAGMEVVITKCDEHGNVDIPDLREKAEKYKDRLSCLMVTYPSTHGVYEEGIHEICDIIHQNGGRVYMDGANMNAQVGLTSPARIGADVCHLNLHKTFCIPHGGGGPGMGPIGVVKDLAPFLPGHPLVKTGGALAIEPVSAAPYGSADILLISYAYIAMMGGEGLTEATQYAILNANYIQKRLAAHYPILYVGTHGRSAHEMIVDCRAFKKVTVEDIAKRLMDYGFHAPTMSFPVAGTIMIEPTESETKAELDRFCEALIEIRREIEEVETGQADALMNVMKQAPHTFHIICANEWTRPYSREKAAFPLEWVRERKFWPSVGRVDNAYGDRNLVCACLPIEAYQQEETNA